VVVLWIRAGCVPFVRLLLAAVKNSVVILWRYTGYSYDAADGSQTDIPPVLCEYQHAYIMEEWVLCVLRV
jgi:hypothetical protein